MNIAYKNKNIFLPDFLIVGASRSGTSSLYFYLREHPEIFMPEFKEPHFFSFFGKESPHPGRQPWNVMDYSELFSPAGHGQILGEASTSYLYYFNESIGNIKYVYGDRYIDLKIIIVLRNPIERAWSSYLLRRRTGYDKGFFEVIDDFANNTDKKIFHNFIDSGMYYEQLKVYLSTFCAVKILFFDDLMKEAANTVRSIYDFLNLKNTDFSAGNLGKVYNASGIAKGKMFQPIHNLLFKRSKIKNFFKPLIPYTIRQNIKSSLGKMVMSKDAPPQEIKDYLSMKFKKDLSQLVSIFPDERHKNIIEGWMTQECSKNANEGNYSDIDTHNSLKSI